MPVFTFHVSVEVDLDTLGEDGISKSLDLVCNRLSKACIDSDVECIGCGFIQGELDMGFTVDAPGLAEALGLAVDRIKVANIGGL
jgi:hypothetical protein